VLKSHSDVAPVEKRRLGDTGVGENAPKSRTTVGEGGQCRILGSPNGVVVIALVADTQRQSYQLSSLDELVGRRLEEMIAGIVIMLLVLIPYIGFRVLNNALGDGPLARAFFVDRESMKRRYESDFIVKEGPTSRKACGWALDFLSAVNSWQTDLRISGSVAPKNTESAKRATRVGV
jgi:hypothetical protein